MAQMSPVRVAVIAGSPQVRASLLALANATPAFESVGGAADAGALADGFAGAMPDVIVIDLEPDAGDIIRPGLDSTPALPALVMLADEVDSAWIGEALPGHAIAILPRDATPDEIVAAIEAVSAGLCVLAPEMLAGMLAGPRLPRPTASAVLIEALTPRETEVLAMLAEGLGNKSIARQLDISDNTVKFHLASIFSKLGASSRTEAVMLGMRHGLIMV
ncbi:response regulator transcription factor [Cupriavidus sp. IDO]|uniref:response regulator transcription factor n=1 Tax=Cupriavidus sp. IDO TaxID=1539142 RepID=UPI003FCEDEDD